MANRKKNPVNPALAGVLLALTVILAPLILIFGCVVFFNAKAPLSAKETSGYELTYCSDNTAVIKITTQKPEEYVRALKQALDKIQEHHDGVSGFITTEIKILVKPKPPVPQKGT